MAVIFRLRSNCIKKINRHLSVIQLVDVSTEETDKSKNSTKHSEREKNIGTFSGPKRKTVPRSDHGHCALWAKATIQLVVGTRLKSQFDCTAVH